MPPPRLEHTYLSTNGVTLHAVRAGPADGPLIVLLHGFPELWYAWRRHITDLAGRGFRVLAPDQRGYNLSDKPPRVDDYRLDLLARDVVGLVDAEGRKTACIVGHDWGAAVAWWTAMRHPERVASLTAINVPHPEVMRRFLFRPHLGQLRRSWYMFYFQLPRLGERAFAQDGGRQVFARIRRIGRPDAFSDEDRRVYLEAWAQPGAPRAMIDWYRAALRDALGPRPDDPRIRVPTQILWGKQDALLIPDMVGPSLALCDEGRVRWFDDATHWVQHEEAAGICEAIAEFHAA